MSANKPIQNSNENYFISDTGIVFTRPRRGSRGGELAQQLNGSGYPCVDLRIGGKKVKGLIHRLVAEAFIPNPENKPCVNHRDGNKLNNHVSNLEWCTYSENMKHAVALGLNANPAFSGEKHPMHKLTADNVRRIRFLHEGGVPSPDIAREFGITKEQVYNIIKGKHWKHTF